MTKTNRRNIDLLETPFLSKDSDGAMVKRARM